jgi:hypothetical protein
MRDLGKPHVLQKAGLAALGSALACYPRLVLWPASQYPLWYYEALLFLGGMVLWAFVFAWSEKYSHRPVFTLRIPWWEFLLVTAAGVGASAAQHLAVDPVWKLYVPEDFPASATQWAAMVLFSLAFTKLFLVFAPFAWLVRLFRQPGIAAALTMVFAIFVVWVKNQQSSSPLPPDLLYRLLAARLISQAVSVGLYLRSGVLLVWWWDLLVSSRLLFR